MSVRFRPLLVLSLLAVAGIALAADLPSNLPKRKPGLWEMQTGTATGQTTTMKLCLDEATDQAMYQRGAQMSGSMCSKYQLVVKGSTVVADGVCNMPGPQGNITMTSHTETRFEGNSSFRTDGHIKYEPALMGHSDVALSNSGRWIGPCTEGQKPGDMILPDGSVMNVKDMGGK
jgi:hypothetical protein